MREQGEKEVNEKRDALAELEQELDFIKRTLLREIVDGTRGKAELDDDWLKKVSGYLKVAESLADMIQARKKDPEIENSPSVRLVWEVLKEIPAVNSLLSEPRIKAQILKQIRARLKQESDAHS